MLLKRTFDLGLLSKHRNFLFGIAALLIVASHLSTKFPREGLWLLPYMAKKYGMIGVEIFLLLSGFGLYSSLSRSFDVAGFYKRRVIRLFVPAFIVAAVYGAVTDMSLPDYIGGITSLAFFWNGKAFWYVAFMMMVYALYPLLFIVQQRSQKGAIVLGITASCAALAVSFLCDLPNYNLRAISRVPIFMLGYVCSPIICEKRKIPAWIAVVAVIVAACAEIVRLRFMPDSYGMRAIVFVPLTTFLVVLFAYVGELIASFRAVHWLYRVIGFCGTISLELYLLFGTVKDILGRYNGSEIKTMMDVAKLDISAFFVAALAGYLLVQLTHKLVKDFNAIHVPEKTNT